MVLLRVVSFVLLAVFVAGCAPVSSAPAASEGAGTSTVAGAGTLAPGGAEPSSPATTVTDASDSAAACSQAARLATERPEEALALIARIRGDLPTPAPSPLPGNFAYCETERLAALAAIGAATVENPPSTDTDIEKAGKSWTAYLADWITPLQNPGLGFLGVLAAALVAARLLILLAPLSSPSRAVAGIRRGLLVVGLTFVALGSWSITGIAASSGDDVLVAWVVGGIALLLGAVALALYLATRLRLAIEVRDAAGEIDEAATTHIVALLGELGASPPRGIEVPRGTDVTALSGAKLDGAPETPIVAAAQRVLTLLLGITPWRVVIDTEGADDLSAVITRNGRSAATAVVDRAQIVRGLSLDDVDLHKFAAATVLTVLADQHPGFEGLAGATSWRSVGLHYIATTDLASDPRGTALLARAVDLDPDNLPAAVALQHRRWRDSKKPVELDAYAIWLRAEAQHLKGRDEACLPLRVRLLATYVVTVLNLRALVSKPGNEVDQRQHPQAHNIAMELCDDLADPKGRSDRRCALPDTLRRQLRPLAATAYQDLHGPLDHWNMWISEGGAVAPAIAYNLACHEASRRPHNEPLLRRLLGTALLDPANRERLAADPELTPLWTAPKLRALVAAPRTDPWELEPFTPHRDKLRAAGLGGPARLMEELGERHRLARYLGVDTFVVDRLIGLAELAQHAETLQDGILNEYRVEMVAALISAGVERVTDVEPSPHSETITEYVKTNCFFTLPKDAVRTWLASVAPPAP